VCLRFMARTHRNEIRHSQIPPDAKTQVQHIVFRRASYENHTGHNRA
jgi:hypothetical protein